MSNKFNLDGALVINFQDVTLFKKHTKRFDFSFLESKCGIYGIKNIETQKIYVGASKDIKNRISSHFNRLRRGIHKVKELQEDYKQFIISDFEIILFTYCLENEMENLEEYYFNLFKPNTYNKRLHTQNNIGLYLSEESKRKMAEGVSKAHKGKIPKNINLIRKLQKRSIIEYTNGIESVRYDSCREAGRLLNVCYKRINRIVVKNSRGENVNPLKEYPDKTWIYEDNKPVRVINRNKNE